MTELANFTEPWPHGDAVFIIKKRKVYASKVVLVMSSPVFNAMFTGTFKEKTAKEIPLPKKDFDTFVKLMKAIHPPNEFTAEDADALLPLAHEYQMTHVLKRCERVLLTRNPSVTNLVLAQTYELPKLYKLCVEYAKGTKLDVLKKKRDFNLINSATLTEILTHKVRSRKSLKARVGSLANAWSENDELAECFFQLLALRSPKEASLVSVGKDKNHLSHNVPSR